MSLRVFCRVSDVHSGSVCIFTTSTGDSSSVVATKTPVPAEVLHSQATDPRKLNLLRSKLLDRAFIFQFDGVLDPLDPLTLEAATRQLTYDLVTGRDAAVLVFGTTR